MDHKVIEVPRWVLLGNNGAGWLPNVSLIANDMPHRLRERVVSNEYVHQLQQDELGYFRWVFLYLKFHMDYGYRDNPFERDSRTWDDDVMNRPVRAWASYVTKED